MKTPSHPPMAPLQQARIPPTTLLAFQLQSWQLWASQTEGHLCLSALNLTHKGPVLFGKGQSNY